jgi:DNA-directed RNA polymerase subunit H (RpoH/RPB5)
MSHSDVPDLEVVSRLFEVKKNQLKMIQRRGYNIDREKNILQLTLVQFSGPYVKFAQDKNTSFRSILTNVYENLSSGKKILVYYADVPSSSTQLGVEGVGDAIDNMRKYNLHDAVIITAKQLSPPAVKHVSGLVAYNIQIFLEEELGYDPTEHFLVPKHTPLTDDEQRLFLEKNSLSIDQLPIIRTDDVIIKYLGLRAGRIVKIERKNMYETMIIDSVCYKAVRED